MAHDLASILARGGKLILLGPLPPRIASIAAIEPISAVAELATRATCEPAPLHQSSESRAALLYAATGLGAASPLRRRCLVRFDYADEWNNLGYGRIGVGGDRWSIAQLARACATVVADVVDGDRRLGTAVALHDTPSGSVLWFARPVGPVDGQDWAVMEAFISRHRAGELPCRPYLRGIPHGFAAGVTTRSTATRISRPRGRCSNFIRHAASRCRWRSRPIRSRPRSTSLCFATCTRPGGSIPLSFGHACAALGRVA